MHALPIRLLLATALAGAGLPAAESLESESA